MFALNWACYAILIVHSSLAGLAGFLYAKKPVKICGISYEGLAMSELAENLTK